jgi:erythromycin esterase-like protein
MAEVDYDPLLKRTAGARFVLLGEASHGTHEFYRERAEITKRLIAEQRFTVVAVEGDWPDAYRVNRFVRGESNDADAEEALSDFRRWNPRDRHMADTLDALVDQLERTQGPTKAAVWAHNSHVGDARATRMGASGELSIGQLARERYGRETLLVGFTT